MKTLTLLRHAKSDWDDGIACDFDRPLNDKGRRAAAAMGRRLRNDAPRFDHVVASPARRVVQTIDAFAHGYGDLPAPAWQRPLYLAPLSTLLDTIRQLPAGVSDALIVAHNPGLGDLALALAAAGDTGLRAEIAVKYPTATATVIEAEGDWTALADRGGRLVAFVRPRDLDPAFGPETA